MCCDSWGHKELDTTERLNRTELNWGGLKEFYLQEDWELIEKEERPRHQGADPETKSGSEQGKSDFPIQEGAHRVHSPLHLRVHSPFSVLIALPAIIAKDVFNACSCHTLQTA